jgi:FAD/FMN-containing dehydrogenase
MIPNVANAAPSSNTSSKVITLTPENLIHQLQSILRIAAFNKLPITMKGSQHSQGEHTCMQNAIQLDFSLCTRIKQISSSVIRVQSGATWKHVLEFLHPLGLSVHTMQSDFDFSVGGTLSTNVHGWQLNSPPIINTVEGFHLMLADCSIVYCTRHINPNLFSAVIGGYGLLGIILDVDLRITKNKMYSMDCWIGETADFFVAFPRLTQNPKARMFFGRFILDQEHFLKQMVMITYNETKDALPNKPLKVHTTLERFTNWLFRKTYDNNTYRRYRWNLETGTIIKWFTHTLMRNELLYHSADNYISRDADTLDLLQEYFIPTEHFLEFVSVLRSMRSELMPHLMNITLRQVSQDSESLMSYAPTNRLCFVMFFRGKKTCEFEQIVRNLSIKLTSHALALKGTYYLPYRAYQTKLQFQQSYPKYEKFNQLKLMYDPNNLFNNQFYEHYLKQ